MYVQGVTPTILLTVVVVKKSYLCHHQILSSIPQPATSLTHIIYTSESFDSVFSFRHTLQTILLLKWIKKGFNLHQGSSTVQQTQLTGWQLV